MQDGRGPLLAEKTQQLLVALPAVLYLLHCPLYYTEEEVCPQLGAKTLLKCLKMLRQYPVIPLIGVLPLCTSALLQASPALSSQGMKPVSRV